MRFRLGSLLLFVTLLSAYCGLQCWIHNLYVYPQSPGLSVPLTRYYLVSIPKDVIALMGVCLLLNVGEGQ
jgi:hypothetical protein